MSERKVYKVFKVGLDGLESCVVFPKELRVVYKPNEWAEGYRGTPLLAFSNEKDARRFVERSLIPSARYEIWECKAEGVQDDVPWVLYHPVFGDDVVRFWNGKYRRVAMAPPPRGTVACKRVKPVRLVEKVEPLPF